VNGGAGAADRAERERGDAHEDLLKSRPATRHVVCFEESGECTLERIAREAGEHDGVEILGPAAFAARIHAYAPKCAGAIEQIARIGGVNYAMLALRRAITARGGPRHWTELMPEPTSLTELRKHAGEDGSIDLAHDAWFQAMPAFLQPDAVTVVHGPIAEALVIAHRQSGPPSDDDPRDGLRRAGVPCALPPAPAWPEGRRARIRRELGLVPRDIAVLVGCERAETVDLSFLARAVGMAVVGGAAIRLVVSPATPRWQEIDAFLRGAANGKPIVVDARVERPWELLPALDACVLDRDGALERPDVCAGWRPPERLPRSAAAAGDAVSSLPALWSLACGVPALVQASIDLGAHAGHALVSRFDRDVAELARRLARAGNA
jgi:hypothetical protein